MWLHRLSIFDKMCWSELFFDNLVGGAGEVGSWVLREGRTMVAMRRALPRWQAGCLPDSGGAEGGQGSRYQGSGFSSKRVFCETKPFSAWRCAFCMWLRQNVMRLKDASEMSLSGTNPGQKRSQIAGRLEAGFHGETDSALRRTPTAVGAGRRYTGVQWTKVSAITPATAMMPPTTDCRSGRSPSMW
jgi:hypothetical protein